MNNKNENYIKNAREIIRSYLNSKEATQYIALLMVEEAEEKYEYLKEHIVTVRNIMDKALKEIEKLEEK